jgi:hypothetical protein
VKGEGLADEPMTTPAIMRYRVSSDIDCHVEQMFPFESYRTPSWRGHCQHKWREKSVVTYLSVDSSVAGEHQTSIGSVV